MNVAQRVVSGLYVVFVKRYSVASKTLLSPQEAALEEQCILIDENDKVLGGASKRDCHKVNPNGSILLHRAFSVFLFNSKNELLIQKRSPQKITFPDCFTNSCCSHPLYDIPGELEETGALGIRRAAQRRLQYELGVPPTEAPLEEFQYLTRIHYQASNDGGLWGEHEIDYILFLHKDVTVKPNADEISEVSYITKDKLASLAHSSLSLTPWFRLIINNDLHLWWDNINNLKDFIDHTTIHKLP